jgi:hypothetical protein
MCIALQARRAARDARRGFDVRGVVQDITHFMSSHGDMLALPTGGKHALVRVPLRKLQISQGRSLDQHVALILLHDSAIHSPCKENTLVCDP